MANIFNRELIIIFLGKILTFFADFSGVAESQDKKDEY